LGLVILQTPVNWFSAPWIYKKYVDEVFDIFKNPDIARALEDYRRHLGKHCL
jgi:Flavodoxin-like fold